MTTLPAKARRATTTAPSAAMQRVLDRAKNVKKNGRGWVATCPAHDDKNPSLSIKEGSDGRALLICRSAGCPVEKIAGEWGLTLADLYADSRSTPAAASGCTLGQYASSKQLPREFLERLGLAQITRNGAPAVRMPYRSVAGEEIAVRFRCALSKAQDGADNRFAWRTGAKPCLYGQERIALARSAGYVVLVEGESDCHTLWLHDVPAIGLPGASAWKESRDAAVVADIPTIFVIVEPDQGGAQVMAWLATSAIRDRVRLIHLSAAKDASGLYLDDPGRFRERWDQAMKAARPWADVESEAAARERDDAWAKCETLARTPRILDAVVDAVGALGVVGEDRVVKLVYLAVTSRRFDRPVSLAVKGPSSGGKSFSTEQVLKLIPQSAYFAMTGMSDHALVYSDEPLKHRHLVIYEAQGMASDTQSYLVRSLLSEGHLRYPTVEKQDGKMVSRIIDREGPTGLIVTTTAASLHPENETRMLSIVVNDTPDQTRRILCAIAEARQTQVDPEPWHALQTWLDHVDVRVTVPFAMALASKFDAGAVRIRRDFTLVLTLVRAHALLHAATRDRDGDGAIVATADDYAAVRGLVADLISDGVGKSVSSAVRETVEAVCRITSGREGATASNQEIAAAIGIDESAASRRAKEARTKGYLQNLEPRRGVPAKYVVGTPLPGDGAVLPTVAEVLQDCRVASGGLHPPPQSCDYLTPAEEQAAITLYERAPR